VTVVNGDGPHNVERITLMKVAVCLFVLGCALSGCATAGPVGSARAVNNDTVDLGACATYPVKPGRSDQLCNRHNGSINGSN